VYAGGGGTPNLPDWFAQAQGDYPVDRLKHAAQVRLSAEKIQRGERVLIVGSGLTSGHLAIGAVRRGATVVMMARRSYYEKLFDAEPGWLGPKYLKDFWAETSWEVRARQVKEARNGGSLTPAILTKLRKLKAEHRIVFHEHCQIRSLVWANHEWSVQCEGGEVVQCDRIWVATGSQLNIQQHPLFAQVLEKRPIDVVQGFPVLNEQLRWKGCPLYLMGGFAGLQVGPTARNLSGARMASERITAGLIQQH
jgi:cation diffusion facilitator CzcD-associated flavoprotein CzcO